MGKYDYKKHIRGGRGRRNESRQPYDGTKDERSRSRERNCHQSWNDLRNLLNQLDGNGYGSYNALRGKEYQHNDPSFTLTADSIQGDAYASPSRFHVMVEAASAKFPMDLLSTKDRRISVADFLSREFVRAARSCGADARQGGRGWHSVKGGDLFMSPPSQHVLERTNVIVHADGSIEARFTVGLPARGRSICGDLAATVLVDVLPTLVQKTLICPTNLKSLWAHVHCVEDQIELRNLLLPNNLVAFICNDAILPRETGESDAPLARSSAIPFKSPGSSTYTFNLPHKGEISGMGIPRGITLLVGGGYHGKSTVLEALEVGIYNHVPGDGREFVVIDPTAVKIRAEDGRNIACCDVSPFISNLPFGQSTTEFSSSNASGSTSQAANIMEAIEAGATTLLMDEDTCATNFMIRDRKMQQLVARDKEPISPYISKAEALFKEFGVSSVLVIGGAGDYFSIADSVFMMDSFQPKDVTQQAKAIASKYDPVIVDEQFLISPLKDRIPLSHGFKTDGRVRSNGIQTIQYGEVDIDLSAVNQLVEQGQVKAIARLIHGNFLKTIDGRKTLKELLDKIECDLNTTLDTIDGEQYCGGYVRPRRFEILAAINRLRTATIKQL